MKRWILMLISSLMLVSCSTGKVNPKKEDNTSLIDYFPNNPVEMTYQGLGNEYAQYTETFYESDGSYYPSIIDNGGTRILRIYQVTEDKISIVYEQPEFYEEQIPSISSLKSQFKEQPILTLPLAKGKSASDWKIVNLNEEVSVPYGKFSHVIVLEKTNDDRSITRQYWVKTYGKIKDELITTDSSGNQNSVTSELQTVK